MSDENCKNVIIIGSGPAGYTAAIYTARALLNPFLITGFSFGGQLMTTSDIENFPGYVKGVAGSKMMSDLHEQAERFGTKFCLGDVIEIELTNYPYKVTVEDESKKLIQYTTKSIIVATGAKAIWLNAKGEDKLKGKGISTCATCDGAFFKDEEVVVVGGGDSAMEEALFLTKFATKVILIHRRNEFRASKIMIDKVMKNSKIQIKTPYIVSEWLVENDVIFDGAIIKNTETGLEEKVDCSGAFIAIGHTPCTDFLENKVELNKGGYVKIATDTTMTSVPGVFACGDVCDTRYKQAITAAGEGCKAAMDCEKWLEHH